MEIETVAFLSLPRARTRVSFAALLFFAFVVAVDVSAMTPLLPVFTAEFSLSITQAGWVFTGIFLAGGVMTVLLPRAGDVFGDRIVAIICPAIVGIGCTLIALARSYPFLLAGVVCLGVATAAPAVVVAAGRRVAGEAVLGRVVAFGLASGLLGGALGGIVSGWAVGIMPLSTYFFILAALSFVAAGIVVIAVPSTRPAERGRLGVESLGLLVLWVVTILFSVSQASAWGLLDPRTLGVFAAGAGLALLWGIRERQQPTPVIDFALFSHNGFRSAFGAALALGLPMAGVSLLIPMLTQIPEEIGGIGMTPMGTAWVMLPYALCAVVGNLFAGRATTAGYPLVIAAVGASLHAFGAIWLAFLHTSATDFVVATVVYGLGFGMVLGGLQGSVQRSVPSGRAGMAAGAFSLAVTVSAALGPVLFSLVLSRDSLPGGVPTDRMFVDAFLLSALCELVVLIFCLLGVRGERQARKSCCPGPRVDASDAR